VGDATTLSANPAATTSLTTRGSSETASRAYCARALTVEESFPLSEFWHSPFNFPLPPRPRASNGSITTYHDNGLTSSIIATGESAAARRMLSWQRQDRFDRHSCRLRIGWL